MTQVSYFMILGFPVIFYFGVLGMLFLILGYFFRKKIKWHKRLSILGVVLAGIHGIMGLWNYF